MMLMLRVKVDESRRCDDDVHHRDQYDRRNERIYLLIAVVVVRKRPALRHLDEQKRHRCLCEPVKDLRKHI